MQIKGLLQIVAAAALWSLALPSTAEETMPYHGLSEQERQEVRERWDRMGPEERAEVRQRARDYWAGLSEEEREAKREELRRYHARGERSRAHGDWHKLTPEERQAHREQLRERWEAMTPEERRAHREMMRSHRAGEPGDGKDEAAGKARAYGKDKDDAGRGRKD